MTKKELELLAGLSRTAIVTSTYLNYQRGIKTIIFRFTNDTTLSIGTKDRKKFWWIKGEKRV